MLSKYVPKSKLSLTSLQTKLNQTYVSIYYFYVHTYLYQYINLVFIILFVVVSTKAV